MRVPDWRFVLVVAAIASSPEAAVAQAGLPFTAVSFVSASGADADDCGGSPATACQNLQAAFDNTRTNGYIYVLGEYIPNGATIDRSMHIKSQSRADIMFTSGAPVTVNAPSGQTVTFENLTFASAAIFTTPATGVAVTGAGKVTFKNCRFDRLAAPAIDVKGPAGARVLLDEVTIQNNGAGVRVKGAGGAANSVFIQRSLIDANAGYAVQVDGAANVAVISSSTLSGSGGLDLSLLNGGRAASYRNNVIRSGTPTQTLPTN